MSSKIAATPPAPPRDRAPRAADTGAAGAGAQPECPRPRTPGRSRHDTIPDTRPRGARARMRLPDGQHLEVTLVSWHQYHDGSWRARVRWPVWGAYGPGPDVETRASAMESFVPADALGPLEGEHYRRPRKPPPRMVL